MALLLFVGIVSRPRRRFRRLGPFPGGLFDLAQGGAVAAGLQGLPVLTLQEQPLEIGDPFDIRVAQVAVLQDLQRRAGLVRRLRFLVQGLGPGPDGLLDLGRRPGFSELLAQYLGRLACPGAHCHIAPALIGERGAAVRAKQVLTDAGIDGDPGVVGDLARKLRQVE